MIEKGPERVGEIVSRLMTARGWGRRQERLRFERAWAESIGEPGARQTRVGGLRRGVLEIIVGNAVLMQELAHFRKRKLLQELQSRLTGITLKDLRFRAGVIESRDE
jgi:hypothetical protein